MLAADRRRPEPLTIPRPTPTGLAIQEAASGPNVGLHHGRDGSTTAVGLEGMLALARANASQVTYGG